MQKPTDTKITSVIVKINQLTSQEKIDWEIEKPPASLIEGSDAVVPIFMRAAYNGKYIALYQRRFQAKDLYLGYSNGLDKAEKYWVEKIVFALMDSQRNILWSTSTPESALRDLLDTVKAKIANVDQFFDDILGIDLE